MSASQHGRADLWQPISAQTLSAAFRFTPVDEVRQRLVALNPGHDHRKLLATPEWDIQSYNRPNRPAIVGEVSHAARAAFSEQRGDRVQDLAFKMPGQGYRLPALLEPYLEAVRIAIETERAINIDFAEHEDDYHAYITIDQKLVAPHRTQRRQGFHGDAFLTPENADLGRSALTENTYLVCDSLPTEFKAGPFDLSDVYPDIARVLSRFDELAAAQETLTFPMYQVVRVTPFEVHSPTVNHTDEPIERTFLKITFSRERFNREGNGVNPLLTYDNWFWVPRNREIRNLRNVIVDWDRQDHDQFRAVVEPAQLSPDWCDLRIFWAYKTEGVRAERARKGQSLQTTVSGFVVSVNIAQDGDWLITTQQDDQYFLPDEKFRARYYPEPNEQGLHLPTPEPLPMVRITAPIRLRAPWGAMQYAPPGSVLVLKQNDVYAIHRANFERSYRKIGERGSEEDAAQLMARVIGHVREAALRAAERLRRERSTAAATAQLKDDGTFVSALDYEIERLYIDALFEDPELAGRVHVLGEESFVRAGVAQTVIDGNRMAFGNANFVVVVDPVDNTKGYVRSDTTNYATVAAVLYKGNPVYYIAVAPEADELYEGHAVHAVHALEGETVKLNGSRVGPFREPLAVPARLLAAGLYWVRPNDPLGPILPEQFQVTDRFGSFQLAVARMTRREPALPSQDGVITSGSPYYETIPAAAIIQLSGGTTVRSNGLAFFPIQWPDLAARYPQQLIGGSTQVVNSVRQLRIKHPLTRS